MWTLFAMEAALRLRLESTASLKRLIELAEERGLIPQGSASALDAGREIRSRVIHGGVQPIWTLGMAEPVSAAAPSASSGRSARLLALEPGTIFEEGLMEPTLQRVTIGDLTLQPYFYEESSEDGAVLVRMKAAITADEQDRLFAMRKPKPGQFLDVVGPDGVTKSLRLGRLLWSRDGEQLRQEINLVDKAWDAGTEEHSSWMLDVMEPFRTRAEEQLALQVARLARLVDALVDAGALTAEQATAARDVPAEDIELRRREYLRVDDLDACGYV